MSTNLAICNTSSNPVTIQERADVLFMANLGLDDTLRVDGPDARPPYWWQRSLSELDELARSMRKRRSYWDTPRRLRELVALVRAEDHESVVDWLFASWFVGHPDPLASLEPLRLAAVLEESAEQLSNPTHVDELATKCLSLALDPTVAMWVARSMTPTVHARIVGVALGMQAVRDVEDMLAERRQG